MEEEIKKVVEIMVIEAVITPFPLILLKEAVIIYLIIS